MPPTSTNRKRAKDDDAAAAISTFQFKQLCSFSKLGQDTSLLPPTCTLETHRQAAVDMQASMDRQLKKTLCAVCSCEKPSVDVEQYDLVSSPPGEISLKPSYNLQP